MKIQIGIEVADGGQPLVSVLEELPARDAVQPAGSTVIPQVCFCSAPALEVRDLGEGRITQKEALAALAALGEGWRLETRQELYALVDLGHKNRHGAYSRDESLLPEPYWAADEHPLDPSARVVVWFHDGNVDYDYDLYRARARAVRVAGQ